MPLPLALGRFNARITNRVLGPVVTRMPGFGYVEHRGRRSGRGYRTPVLAFRHGDRMTFAATYGTDADWVQNLIAAGGGTFAQRRGRWTLSAPRLYHDLTRSAVPWPVRVVLRLLDAADFLEVRASAIQATEALPFP
jgi:deazaflavin-dependent oxidoreductase (nitroreductase family)